MKMSKKDVATLLIVLGVGGYSYYGSETGTGPIGWMNYAQQAIFGSYDGRFSFLLAICFAVALVAIAEFGWKMVSGSRDSDTNEQSIASRLLFGPRAASSIPPVPQNPTAALASQNKVLLQSAGIVVIAIWTIGFAIYWSYAAEQREDAGAQYEQIDLSNGAPLRQPQGSHIALQGGVPLDDALAHTTESLGTTREDYQLVPIAPRTWVKGQAVVFVLKVKDRSELQDPIPTSPSAQGKPTTTNSLMARIDGPVPGPVALEFKKIGVTLGEPNYLLHLVNTSDGRVNTVSSEDAFLFYLGFCGLLSAAICAMMGMVWFMRARAAGEGLS